MGPLVRRDDVNRMKSLIKDAISKGAKLEYGGKVPKNMENKGNWFEPTVLSGMTTDMDLFKKETQ